jgi:hypothetical protein
VGDHQAGEPQVVAQPQQQAQDLPAHRRVEGGHRLVGDQDGRVQDQGAGDDHPLSLPPGELVGEAQEEPFGRPEPRPGQRVGHGGRLVGDAAVDAQPFGHRVVDGVPRVERAARVLEHSTSCIYLTESGN